MADTNINESSRRETQSLLGDMSTAFDSLRVIHDLMVDQLCDHITSDVDSSMRLNERIYVLLEGLKHKLDDVETLREKVLDLSLAEQAS